ncbi:MAG: N-acetylmuramic acid 6-phosphate etherase [Mycoplasmataceae bacterium]|jgi:N-acetylmuramic acid 6-phosphate etherase|nr:N-acetylmuramic acid 6-phosphate etherase [Mycoplasmataceae bacterium]
MKQINLQKIITESVNPKSIDIDLMSSLNIARTINQEDNKITKAIVTQLKNIAKAIDAIVLTFIKGGRLVYIGAGTSGRLGILDASEIPPTYGAPSNLVIGLIAGGKKAILNAVEGAEDDQQAAINDLKKIKFSSNDTLVGISASGRTPYVVRGLQFAKQLKARTVAISTNKNSDIGKLAQIKIEVITGPEVITGSTRMKSGTAQKMVLNMLSTGAMIKMGKVYRNLMVDVLPKNAKLVSRVHNIVKTLTNANETIINRTLQITKNRVKEAVVMIKKHVDYPTAVKLLKQNHGILRKVID